MTRAILAEKIKLGDAVREFFEGFNLSDLLLLLTVLILVCAFLAWSGIAGFLFYQGEIVWGLIVLCFGLAFGYFWNEADNVL